MLRFFLRVEPKNSFQLMGYVFILFKYFENSMKKIESQSLRKKLISALPPPPSIKHPRVGINRSIPRKVYTKKNYKMFTY